MTKTVALVVAFAGVLTCQVASGQSSLELRLQSQSKSDAGEFVMQHQKESWKAAETAIIVCDAWDYHHCFNAVGRLNEMAPTMNRVIAEARRRGVTIIHSPSDCVDFYKDSPARKRAVIAPAATNLPKEIESWCYTIPAEEDAEYPVDQSDGGEDDDPKEHAEWAAKLESIGRDPKRPWQRQLDTIEIDESVDFITDQGDEVWNVLESKNIDNVILLGVHTNMCVLGRPFGLRQMARNGKKVVLMRDMTDSMYNPMMWPYVSHFEGTRRVISHIERYVCPTMTSDQLIGGEPFRFKGDE
ncbi:putative signal peptide and transmembrane protein [Rhodopirellula islandica]|uniref:Signal peptide and transmembrane protein n=1 Tax=Rhodopirellula islandica TaxID=595434 RepID=A0A0J1B8B5_RHOIS|nr:isochorismatase family protein [Rhodopirellula islandica]KLU03070.1 putative signal peptide and transmembrane protein [Rhodopirellula islandica]